MLVATQNSNSINYILGASIPYLIATWLNRINRRFSRALYHILMRINDKLELKHEALWSCFGWGIIYLCVKNKEIHTNWKGSIR